MDQLNVASDFQNLMFLSDVDVQSGALLRDVLLSLLFHHVYAFICILLDDCTLFIPPVVYVAACCTDDETSDNADSERVTARC